MAMNQVEIHREKDQEDHMAMNRVERDREKDQQGHGCEPGRKR